MSLLQFLAADGFNRIGVADEDGKRVPVAGSLTIDTGDLATEDTLALLLTSIDGMAANIALLKTKTDAMALDIEEIHDNTADVTVAPTATQNPILDVTNGTRDASVTTTETVITPPTGCQFVRVVSDKNIIFNTDGSAAVDDGANGIYIPANTVEIVPVTAATACTALSLDGTALVRCTPYKVR